MRIWAVVATLTICASLAFPQKRAKVDINTETPEGQALPGFVGGLALHVELHAHGVGFQFGAFRGFPGHRQLGGPGGQSLLEARQAGEPAGVLVCGGKGEGVYCD